MKWNVTTVLIILLMAGSCSDGAMKSGLRIEYGPNLGTSHMDKSGVKYFYVHSTAIITNDSLIPIHLSLAMSNELDFPTYCEDSNQYKVFLLPEELTPDTATIYNNIVNGQHDFLNHPLTNQNIINRSLKYGEFIVVTIGVLIPKPSNCAAVPRAVFTEDTNELYSKCENQINQLLMSKSSFEIGVKLEILQSKKIHSSRKLAVLLFLSVNIHILNIRLIDIKFLVF